MTVIGSGRASGPLRAVQPAHELTIIGGRAGKVGVCRCSWYVEHQTTSDDVSRAYVAHLREVGEPSARACDVCQRGFAQVRHGCVVLCATCAIEDLGRTHPPDGRGGV